MLLHLVRRCSCVRHAGRTQGNAKGAHGVTDNEILSKSTKNVEEKKRLTMSKLIVSRHKETHGVEIDQLSSGKPLGTNGENRRKASTFLTLSQVVSGSPR